MTALDVAAYTDLTLFDIDAQPLIDRALAEAAIRWPDWEPREGNTEVVLMEALGLEVAELVYAINRVPGSVVEVLLRLFGLDRDPGTPPTGTVTITVSDDTGRTVAAGTRFRLLLATDLGEVDLVTDVDLVIAGGLSSGTVAVTGDTPTAAGAGTLAGAALQVIDSVPYLDTAVLASDLTAGTDPEDDGDFLDRGIVRLQRLVTTLVLPEHFTASAAEETYVTRAFTIDNYDPGGGGVPGDNPGHVTVAVTGPAGAAVSAPNKALLDTKLEASALATLSVHVADATLTTVAVTVTVLRAADVADADVQAAVTAAVQAYLSADEWAFAGTVYRNELLSVIDAAAGVSRVVTLAAPAADVALTGVAPLAVAGVVTVTVTAP